MFRTFVMAAAAVLSFSSAHAAAYTFHYDFGVNASLPGITFLEFDFDGTLQGDGNTILINTIDEVVMDSGPSLVNRFSSGSLEVGAENALGGAYVTLDKSAIDLFIAPIDPIIFIFDTEGPTTAEVNAMQVLSLTTSAGYFSLIGHGFDEFDAANLSISAVPLPATAPLLIAALGGFAVARRRS